MRHLERDFALTNQEDPLDPNPAREMRANLAAIRHLEEAVVGARWTEGIVLRYGAFYGPGTSMTPGEESFEMVRMMTELRGASNDKAKRDLQWRPAHASWRQGFAA
jgi:nucleoside-diphosphate-sugar epimerase